MTSQRLRSIVFSDGCAIDFETAPGKADGWPYEGIAGTMFRCPHGELHQVSDPNPPKESEYITGKRYLADYAVIEDK